MRKIFCLTLCALALLACKKGVVVPQGEIVYSVTGDYSELTSKSVIVTCSSYIGQFFEVEERGILYSNYPDIPKYNSIQNSVWDGYDKEEYTMKISGLSPSTTYYYRSFVCYRRAFNGQYHYGEIKSFTTLPAE